jgi:DNA-binding transcriptional LysR family regulator
MTLASDAAWDDVRIFVAVMRSLSFRAASKLLRVEQSTVSRRIAALERALGGELFDRTRAGPRPTELALRLAPQAERMAAQWTTLLERSAETSHGIAGRVRLSVPSSFAIQVILPYLIPRLRAAYPRLYVDLVVDERQSDLAMRAADVAVRFVKPDRGELVAKRAATIPTAILANRRYAERRESRVSALDWVVLDLSPAPTLDSVLLAPFTSVVPVMRTTMHLAQIEAVRAGLGVAVLAKTLMRIAPELVEIPVPELTPPLLHIWLVAPKSLSKTPRIRAVWSMLVAGLRELEEARLVT